MLGWVFAKELLIVLPLQQRGVEVQGEVFDYVTEPLTGFGLRGMGPDKLIPLIRFETAEGTPVVIKVNALKEQFPLGSYPLRYLPEEPTTARVQSFLTMWLWSLIMGSGSILMLLATSILLRARRRL